MATRTWSAGNTAFATGLGGTITSGDDILIEEGRDFVITQLDQSSFDVESIQVRSDVSIGVQEDGTVVGALAIDVSNSSDAYLLAAGGGHLRIQGGSGGVIDNVYAQMKRNGTLWLGAATYQSVECESGLVILSGDADPVTLMVAASGARVQVLGDSGDAAITTVDGVAGFLALSRDVATLNVGEGMIVEIEGDFVTPVTINQWGGTIRYNGGDIGTLNAYAGVFDRRTALRDIEIGTAANYGPAWTFIKSDRAATTVSGTDNPIAGGSKSVIA